MTFFLFINFIKLYTVYYIPLNKSGFNNWQNERENKFRWIKHVLKMEETKVITLVKLINVEEWEERGILKKGGWIQSGHVCLTIAKYTYILKYFLKCNILLTRCGVS